MNEDDIKGFCKTLKLSAILEQAFIRINECESLEKLAKYVRKEFPLDKTDPMLSTAIYSFADDRINSLKGSTLK